jgi:four helix bundle protein
MHSADFKDRTMAFALRVLGVADSLPRTTKGRTIANQLCRSGTSVAANYRAACCAKSRADFISKPGIVEEEADESIFWLELLVRAKILPAKRLEPLIAEANEILAMVVASARTAKKHRS